MEHTCVDCSKASPPARTEHTLISAEHGWRLSRGQDADGAVVMQWRCPECWRKYKQGGAPQPSRNSPRSMFRAAVRFFRNSEPPPDTPK